MKPSMAKDLRKFAMSQTRETVNTHACLCDSWWIIFDTSQSICLIWDGVVEEDEVNSSIEQSSLGTTLSALKMIWLLYLIPTN